MQSFIRSLLVLFLFLTLVQAGGLSCPGVVKVGTEFNCWCGIEFAVAGRMDVDGRGPNLLGRIMVLI